MLSIGLTNGTVQQTEKYTIKVVSPLVITADVPQHRQRHADQRPRSSFKVDGAVVNSTVFTIPANSTKTLTYNWTAGGLRDGDHTLEIVLDPGSEFVRFVDGSTTFSSTFHKGGTIFGTLKRAAGDRRGRAAGGCVS